MLPLFFTKYMNYTYDNYNIGIRLSEDNLNITIIDNISSSIYSTVMNDSTVCYKIDHLYKIIVDFLTNKNKDIVVTFDNKHTLFFIHIEYRTTYCECIKSIQLEKISNDKLLHDSMFYSIKNLESKVLELSNSNNNVVYIFDVPVDIKSDSLFVFYKYNQFVKPIYIKDTLIYNIEPSTLNINGKTNTIVYNTFNKSYNFVVYENNNAIKFKYSYDFKENELLKNYNKIFNLSIKTLSINYLYVTNNFNEYIPNSVVNLNIYNFNEEYLIDLFGLTKLKSLQLIFNVPLNSITTRVDKFRQLKYISNTLIYLKQMNKDFFANLSNHYEYIKRYDTALNDLDYVYFNL